MPMYVFSKTIYGAIQCHGEMGKRSALTCNAAPDSAQLPIQSSPARDNLQSWGSLEARRSWGQKAGLRNLFPFDLYMGKCPSLLKRS